MNKAELSMVDNILKNTGRPIEQWIDLVNKSGVTKHSEIIKLLKDSHGFTYGFANFVAHKSKKSDAGSAENSEDLVSAQYKGKENLRMLYDKLIAEITKFGKDVELSPKNSYVSLRRKKQFALIQPTTKSRLDIGLNIKGKTPQDKLEASGSFNSMCTHRVKVEDIKEIDKKVIGWLKEAYDNAG